MSENKSYDIFPAVMYKSLDYVFESSTSFKVMMNLLDLPTPYVTGSSDLYPHTGHLPEDTYRTLWIRGNVISMCDLNDSVLDDLRKNYQQNMNIPESYCDYITNSREEVIPSSYPDSVDDSTLSEAGGISLESTNPCNETFSKMQINQITLEKENKDLYIPEKIMEVDYLKQFKRHLPLLKTKLSRLRTFPVADPLLSFKHDNISEDMMHRHCERYETAPNTPTRDNWSSTISLEEFSKVQLNNEELVLPNILETCAFALEHHAALSNICDLLMIKPEEMDENISSKEVIQRANQNISQVEIYELQTSESLKEGFTDTEPTEKMKTSADMEMDLTLSPVHKECYSSLSTATLFEEPFSPQGEISFGSLKAQRELEKALWTAEKLPTFVLGFILTEPQTCEPPMDFQPLSEALRILKSEEDFSSDKSTSETGFPQTPLCSSIDFIESIRSDIPPLKTEFEEFKKTSPEQDFSIPSIPTPRSLLSNLKRPEEPAVDPLTDHNKPHKNDATVYRHLQTLHLNQFGQAKISNPNCPERILVSKQNDIEEKIQLQPIKKTLTLRERPESVLEDPACKDLDPLSTFIILRSQQAPPVTVSLSPNCAVSKDMIKQVFCSEPQTTDQGQRIERLYMNAAVSGNASREQNKAVSKCMPPILSNVNKQLQKQDRVVIQVQATEYQYQAFCEVLSFSQSYMNFVQKLGLDMKVWGDFRCLTMDQTHFLVKQQEKALSISRNIELINDEGDILNQVTQIHVLVTLKELLLKCSLSTGVEFLKSRNMGDEKRFKQLLKRLQIILYLSHMKQETDPKLLELQRLLTTSVKNRKKHSVTEKILVLISNNSSSTRSIILGCLHKLIGVAAVADLHLDKDKMKLNDATVVSSVCDSECALVCEQHIGPDFPWQCFSRLVEYDHPGPSPWASVCSERGLIHVSFNTAFPDNDEALRHEGCSLQHLMLLHHLKLYCSTEGPPQIIMAPSPLWREENSSELSPQHLENSVPHVLFVTEGLLNCPMLLQTLESTFNITVLERNHSMTLQMLGGTHQYAVITVNESTAIVIQKQEELCQESASEGLVMRLSALSLQYSCCWLILHCPDSRGGGFSSEAFRNLILVYSALVIFSMNSEDLNVKVLMVSNVLDMAKWINQICFHNLMSSEMDPAGYLNREWLTISESSEEKCLLHFPCINPMVSQLMLRRAPNLQWLLSAPLPVLKEMLPEVPHKVLKLFNDTTSLYTHTSGLKKCESPAMTKVHLNNSDTSAWFTRGNHQHLSVSPVPDLHVPFYVQDSFWNAASIEETEPDMRFNSSTSFLEPDANKQTSWNINDMWKDERDEVNASDWRGGSGAIGKMVRRVDDLMLPQHNSFITTHQIKFNSPFKAESTFRYNSELDQSYGLSPPGGEVTEQAPGFSPNFTRATATYGSKSFVGQERKRSGDAETLLGRVLTPLKRSRLSYEKVPGRSDGQTRLKLF